MGVAPRLHKEQGEMRRLLTLLIAFTLAGAAQAAPQTSGLARQREEVVALDARRADLARERRRLETELEALSGEIAALKARGQGLLGGGKLDRKLVRSRDLSARIDALRGEEARVRAELERKASALVAAYDTELSRVRAELRGARGPARAALLDRLSTLEARRRQVRAGLSRLFPDPAPGAPAVRGTAPALALAEGPTEGADPDTLRAEADRLRDTRDRLLRRIRALEKRREELHAQAELEAELRSFDAETSLFDENDYSVVQVTATRGGGGGGAERAVASGAADNALDMGAAAGAAPGGAEAAPSDARGAGAEVTSPAGADTSDTQAFFQLGRSTSRIESLEAAGALLEADDTDASEADLEGQVRSMKEMADRLEARARSLEKQAETLDR